MTKSLPFLSSEDAVFLLRPGRMFSPDVESTVNRSLPAPGQRGTSTVTLLRGPWLQTRDPQLFDHGPRRSRTTSLWLPLGVFTVCSPHYDVSRWGSLQASPSGLRHLLNL